jgi:hypothetical protein
MILQTGDRPAGVHVLLLPVPCPHAIVAAPQRREAGRMNSSPPLGELLYAVCPEALAVGEARPPDAPEPPRHPHGRGAPGHRDVTTTMIYTHVLNRGAKAVRSPLD